MTGQYRGAQEICRLCRTVSELRHSHVIPRFMYRRMSGLSGETPQRFSSQRATDRPGHLKEYMLCEACEREFSDYERLASQFVARLCKMPDAISMEPIRQTTLDYTRLKLFFLSVLWRCAVCTDSIVHRVELGPHLCALTTLLLRRDPGAENEIPILLRLLAQSTEVKHAVLTVPERTRLNGRSGYQMYGIGLEISWVLDKRGASREDVPYILKSDGTWRIKMVSAADCGVWQRACSNAIKREHDRSSARALRR